MPDYLVRNADDETFEAHRVRAKRNNRSVEAEVKSTIEEATRTGEAARQTPSGH